MCGDLEEDTAFDDLIFGRFADFARRHGAVPQSETRPLTHDLTEPEGRGAYMNGLFRDALVRALNDTAGAAEGSRADAIAGQAIVFARLAGMLAAQLPPESDVFRASMEAFMDGHGEPARIKAGHHHHGHGHGHDHEH
ncbi:MAG: hypothetical protein OEY16_06500 [Alphaproteobacteria bacterium]|nr:hypothetical protein [Alphaproteobacteria bacterium]